MKLSKNLMKVGLTALSVSVIGFFSACTGPTGPAGKDGGKGMDGTTPCSSCHSEKGIKDISFKFSQFQNSRHNTGIIYEEEAGRIQCGGCHTQSGFAEAATLGQDDAKTMATGKLSCRTCHTIHSAYDSTDFKLRINSGFKLRQFGTSDGMVDFGKGNICAKCHQARNYVHNAAGYDTLKASKGTSFARFGPHYGVVANVFAMKGLEDMGVNETNPHATVSCTTCHMGSDATNPATGGHTFYMPEANLASANSKTNCAGSCHTADAMKSGSIFNSVKGDLSKIRQKLLDLKMLDTTQTAGSEGYNVLGEYAYATDKAPYPSYKSDDPKFKALINYMFIVKDRSNGVHNPKYVKAMIEKMKAALGL